jgi:hypothetical protein
MHAAALERLERLPFIVCAGPACCSGAHDFSQLHPTQESARPATMRAYARRTRGLSFKFTGPAGQVPNRCARAGRVQN